MAKFLKICSKLPHGLILENPMNASQTVEIAGLNSIMTLGLLPGDQVATTNVDEDFWNSWTLVHKDFPALKSGALFVAKDDKDARAIERELSKVKSGFERLVPKQEGVEPADFSKNQ